jgi:hypothetical protein
MPSYSIALLLHADPNEPKLLEHVQSFRQHLPFAAIYLYCDTPTDGVRLALQKLDVTIRHDDSGNRFKVVRRMFTEVDADIFVYAGNPAYPPSAAATMVHQLVEARLDMAAAVLDAEATGEEANMRRMCEGLYGRRLISPLSGYRVFSRRYVKSFAAFERGFPIELEWSIHALELDIPYREFPFQYANGFSVVPHPTSAQAFHYSLTRFILNLQARPLKWFGVTTAVGLGVTATYKFFFFLHYFGFTPWVSESVSIIGAASFGLMSVAAAVSGLLLHSQSHLRRELKRLHFQQHRTL